MQGFREVLRLYIVEGRSWIWYYESLLLVSSRNRTAVGHTRGDSRGLEIVHGRLELLQSNNSVGRLGACAVFLRRLEFSEVGLHGRVRPPL